MEKAPKLAKLDRFRRAVPHVSASALSKILEKAVEEPPEIKSRRDIRHARDELITQRTDYGPLLVCHNQSLRTVIRCRENPRDVSSAEEALRESSEFV